MSKKKTTQHSTVNNQPQNQTFYFYILIATIHIYYFFVFYYFLFSPTLLGYSLVSICIFFHPGWSMVGPATIHSPCKSSIFFFFILVIPVLPNFIFLVIRLFFWAPGFILLRLIPDFPRWALSKVKCCSYWNTDPTINQKYQPASFFLKKLFHLTHI